MGVKNYLKLKCVCKHFRTSEANITLGINSRLFFLSFCLVLSFSGTFYVHFYSICRIAKFCG